MALTALITSWIRIDKVPSEQHDKVYNAAKGVAATTVALLGVVIILALINGCNLKKTKSGSGADSAAPADSSRSAQLLKVFVILFGLAQSTLTILTQRYITTGSAESP